MLSVTADLRGPFFVDIDVPSGKSQINQIRNPSTDNQKGPGCSCIFLIDSFSLKIPYLHTF